MRPVHGAVCLSLLLFLGCAQEETKMVGGGAIAGADLPNLEQPQEQDAVAERGASDQDVENQPVVAEIIEMGSDEINYTEEMIEVPVEEAAPVAEEMPAEEAPAEEAPAEQPNLNLVAFACSSSAQVLKAGESYQYSWQLPQEAAGFQVMIETSNDGIVGEYVMDDEGVVTYTAPAEVPMETDITLYASIDDGSYASCYATLQADEDLGVEDNGMLEGLVGNVYELEPQTRKLPDFSQMQPLATIVSNSLDVPNRAFDAGFPGVPNLFEWFGISYKGKITIPADGDYEFKLVSDDGANLYIMDEKIVDNDGTHAVRAKTGSVTLTAGQKEITVDYFQGPRYHIALQLFWKVPGSSEFVIVPKEHFHRPSPVAGN